MSVATTTVHDAARALIQQGISVIPIAPGTKEPPVGFRWGVYTTRKPDMSELADWFLDHDYQLAVVCGPESGNLVVLDFDRAQYPDGGYEHHAQQYPEIRKYPRIRTGSGKTHVYVRNADVRSRYLIGAGKDKIEVRAGNHYCVTAPSMHPDTDDLYAWEYPITQLVDADMEAIGLPRRAATERIAPGEAGAPLTEEEINSVICAVEPFWQEGQRHDLCLALCGALANSGVPETDAVAVVSALSRSDEREQHRDYRAAINTTYERYRDGYTVAGWSSLINNRLVDAHAITALESVLAHREVGPLFNITPNTRHPYVMPVRDLLRIPFPPRRYLVEGLVRAKTISLVVGPPKTWKSFVAQEIQIACATGTSAFDLFNVPEAIHTVYVQEESPVEDWQERYREVLAGRGITQPEDVPTTLLTVTNPQPALFFDNEKEWQRFITDVIEPFRPELVIFDPFRNYHHANENDSEAMVPVLHRLKWLRDMYDCTIILVHHSNKTIEHTNPIDAIRGSSSISGAMDGFIFVQNVKAKESKESVTFGASFDGIDPNIRRAQVQLKSGKEAAKEFFFQLRQQEQGISIHGFLKQDDNRTLAERIYDWAQDRNDWWPLSDLHQAFPQSEGTLRTHRKALERSGKLKVRTTGNGNERRWAAKEVPDDELDF